MEQDGIDLLAFTGHKGLLGPQGTGGLVLGERVDLSRFRSWKQGGTGSRSEEEWQPEFLPDRFEAGTPNAVGIAGLGAGVKVIMNAGLTKITQRLVQNTERLREKIASLPGVVLYGPPAGYPRVGIVSFNIRGLDPADIGYLLDEKWGILCRVGLHCAPAAHRTLGSFPAGTVRLAPGFFTGEEEIDYAAAAVAHICKTGGGR
jgi:selenocysteine lyase/cysteine desulfurase